jgi:GPI-anchor transamidase subunit T
MFFFINSSDIYEEKLYIKTLLDGKISFNFEFKTKTKQTGELNHFKLFPKDFGQIVQKNQVKELHLSLTQGRWNYEKWGNNPTPSPVGAELIAWFKK